MIIIMLIMEIIMLATGILLGLAADTRRLEEELSSWLK
jgi:hypothetical protein